MPEPIKLAVSAALIWSGWYAKARETGVARIWSYAAVAVGVYLAITAIAGIVIETVLGV